MNKTLLLALALALSPALLFAADAPALSPQPTVLAGKTATQGAFITAESKVASILLPHGGSPSYTVSGTLTFKPIPQGAKGAPAVNFYLDPSGVGSAKEPGLASVSFTRTQTPEGASAITVAPRRFDAQTKELTGKERIPLNFWPGVEKTAKWMQSDGFAPQTWADRPIPFRIDVTPDTITFWAQGRLIDTFNRPPSDTPARLVLELPAGDRLADIAIAPFDARSLFVPINLAPFANDQFPTPPQPSSEAVPFNLISGPKNQLNLKNAGWIDQKRDPSSYISGYDGGPYIIGDDRMTLLEAPKADYIAAHILAYASDDESFTNTVTLRAGKYGAATGLQVLQKNFTADVPRKPSLSHVIVPMNDAFAQDVKSDHIDIEVTKEVKLVRHYPDPSRYQFRPVGPSSGVKIAAITLEKSPLQMTVSSDEAGHAFVLPKTPAFDISLTNITSEPQPYTLTASFTHLRGQQGAAQVTGTVAPGQTAKVTLPLSPPKLGYYDINISLSVKNRLLLTRTTSFAQLPEDTRKYRDKAPWGAWDWNGTHFTSADPDVTGSLFYKLGYRFGMARYTQEQRDKWGMISGFEAKLEPELKQLKSYLEQDPKRNRNALMFHENVVSGPQATRIPDMFTGRPLYKFNETEQKRFDELYKLAIDSTTAARKEFPDVHIKLGNGPLPMKEALYRHKFPAELFDSAGNEPGSYARPPETQPPDPVAVNASLWMDRQMLDYYGYKDKPVRMCYEVGYPGDNPGNLTSETQAKYFVRHVLHAMAWEQPLIHIGGLTDTGNSYYFSNWGSAAFVRAYPENNIKPAYVALSNMTLALDGAVFKRVWKTPDSLYAIEFSRPDGQNVLALWTLRGKRPVTIQTSATSPSATGWTLMDDQGIQTPNVKTVITSDSPVFLIGPGEVTAVTPGTPVYTDGPGANPSIIAPLANMNGWSVVKERSPELEAYNPMTPRKKGNFSFTGVEDFEGRQGAIRVAAGAPGEGPDTLPAYGELQHADGIPVPGQPKSIGVWVNGNSGWGRVIFELTDASGQRWTSIGSSASGEINPWMLDWMPKEMVAEKSLTKAADWNTDDSKGNSRINFDGWRYVSFGLPGQYPGQDKQRLPDNSYWKSDKDGIVHYPLTLRKIIVELPEKVLHVKSWEPPARPDIYLKDVTVSN